MPTKIDPKIRTLAEKVIAESGSKRAREMLKVLLDKGEVSTDELNDMGYNHPPRVVGDIRDAGIPIITGSATSKRSGRRMAVYRFGSPDDIQSGRIGGRSAFPKAFKQSLISHYGSIDCITGAKLGERVLQIDHRIPYRIAGDALLDDHKIQDYMLLDASSQRAKSWSCENCVNMKKRDEEVCKKCYWAYPEKYEHVATKQIRRLDLVWQESETTFYDKIAQLAAQQKKSVAEYAKAVLLQSAKDS